MSLCRPGGVSPLIMRDFGGVSPLIMRDFALEVWAACRPVTCRFEPATDNPGGFLCCLRKESPPRPERKALFGRLPIDPRPGASKCRLNFCVVARAPTLGTGDILGLGPARSVTWRLLGGLCPLIMRDFALPLTVSHRPVTKPTTAATQQYGRAKSLPSHTSHVSARRTALRFRRQLFG